MIKLGPMHEEKILGSTPNNTHCLVLVSFLKAGFPPLVSMVLTAFETLKNIDFN